MKNLILVSLAILALTSCSKELLTDPVENAIEQVREDFGNLSVMAVRANSSNSSNTTNTTSPNDPANSPHNNGEGCEPNSAPATKVGLFFGNIADANVKVEDADFKAVTSSGLAYFQKLDPGIYTILGENELGQVKLLETIVVGTNDVVLEF